MHLAKCKNYKLSAMRLYIVKLINTWDYEMPINASNQIIVI